MALLGRGLYRILVKVRLLSSLDSIVIATVIGETVEIEGEVALAA